MTRPRGAAVMLAAAALAAPAPAPAQAAQAAQAAQQAAQAAQQGARLAFVSQTPWVGAGGDFTLRFRVDRPAGPSNLEVVIGIYRAVATRSEFAETLRDRGLGFPVATPAVFPLGSLPVDPDGDLTVTVPVGLGRRDGVHPVRVEVRERGRSAALDLFVTHLLYLPEAHAGPKLGVTLVLPVHAPPRLQPDGARRAPTPEDLAAMAAAVDAARALPVSLAPTPETLGALVASSDPRAGAVLTALRQAAAERLLVAGPYVPVSLPALLDAGLDGEVAGQLARGAATLTEVLRVRPDGGTWAGDDPLDAAVVDLLAGRGVTRVVAAEARLTPVPDQLLTLTRPFLLEGRQASVAAVAADAGLAGHFADEGNQALHAAHLLADLAVLYLDLPGDRRGVVAMPARSWRPSRQFWDTVVAGLATNPVVEATTLDTLFATVAPARDFGTPLVRRPVVGPAGNLVEVVADLRAVRRRLDALGSVLGPANAVSGRLDELLLVAQSADLRATRDRDPYLVAVERAIEGEVDGIDMPQNRSITLTSRRGEIPVTFQNRTGHPVRLVVRMQSDKLDFPRGMTQPLELTRLNTTERFPVVARTSGAFPIRITLESPDGFLVVGRARLTVRSTAASGVGLGISLGAALFLALWWGRHAGRIRKQGLARPEDLRGA